MKFRDLKLSLIIYIWCVSHSLVLLSHISYTNGIYILKFSIISLHFLHKVWHLSITDIIFIEKKLFIKGFNIKNRSSALDQGKLQILIASTKIKKYYTSRNLKKKNIAIIYKVFFCVCLFDYNLKTNPD